MIPDEDVINGETALETYINISEVKRSCIQESERIHFTACTKYSCTKTHFYDNTNLTGGRGRSGACVQHKHTQTT